MDAGNSPPRVTLRDISQKLGLSGGAVSRALRNDPTISVATRQRVQAMAAEMGYQPNPLGALLANFKRNSKTVPVKACLAWFNCWPDPKKMRSFAEFDRYWTGAYSSAEHHGYRLEEFVCNESMQPSRVEKILLARGINGILLPPLGRLSFDWGNFNWPSFSTVMLSKIESPPCHLVSPDQMWNTMLAYDKIREKGYKRVGFVGAPWRPMSFAPGFLWAQQLDVPEATRIPPLFLPTEEPRSHQKLFADWMKKHKPDAILTERSHLPEILTKAGYRVPDDVGLATLTVLDCPIDAGIYQNPEEVGRVAVLVLISLISDHDLGIPRIPRQILVKGKWVDGASLPPKN
jgi:LacI family transcriptional regulator